MLYAQYILSDLVCPSKKICPFLAISSHFAVLKKVRAVGVITTVGLGVNFTVANKVGVEATEETGKVEDEEG